jgi:hypothetical protein
VPEATSHGFGLLAIAAVCVCVYEGGVRGNCCCYCCVIYCLISRGIFSNLFLSPQMTKLSALTKRDSGEVP